MSTQSDWRFCQKCQALFYDGYPDKGHCVGGGGHQAAGYNFMPSYNLPETPTAQTAWRYCTRCHAMFFDGYPDKGKCAAGGAHSAQGYVFVLPHDVPGTPTAQTAWRFCTKCHAMFYDGYQDKGLCQGHPLPPFVLGGPARHGGHEAAGYMFVLPHDLPPPPPPLEWFVVDAPSITFGSGIAVGGYGRLTVFSDGTTHFQGHLHDSGFPSYDCLAVFTVKDADGHAYAAPHSGRVHGTDESGSRDLNWDDWGGNDSIRQNWPKIKSGGTGGWEVNVTSDWSPQKIAEDVAAAVGVVLSLIPLIFSGGSSNKSSDPNYGRPEAYPPGGLPPPESQVGGTPP
jgi:hypothetical protein